MPRREQPLESGDDVLLRFARDLRQLREKAGSPTYRQLSARAHYSAAALSEAASGRKLPSRAVMLAYVNACEGDIAAWEERWRDIAAASAVEPDNCDSAPYVGLAAFQTGDADRFFGRDNLINELLAGVREHRFLGVFGASGSGKSSVLRAGLVARLQVDHPAIVITPGPRPMEEFAVRLATLLGASPAVLLAEFAADPRNLQLRVRQALAAKPADLILVVDQFEEVFTLCGFAERNWLITALTEAAFAERSRTRVVLGVRADFYAHCGRHPRLAGALRNAQVLVAAMTSDELRLAITGPAERVGCRVETALVSRLIAVTAYQSGDLPMVSHALLETWRRRRGATLTLAGYEAAGGAVHALARTAEEIHTALDSSQQDIAKQIFLRLCVLGDGTEDTKRRIGRDELDNDNPDIAVVLERLARARLITLDRDTVELAHERLILRWPRLRDWLNEDRDGRRIHRGLTDATIAWLSLDRDTGALYRGIRLARAESWAVGGDTSLTTREREFLQASLAARAREQATAARRTRRLRQLVAVLTVLLVLAGAAIGFAVHAEQERTHQRNAALAQRAIRDAATLYRTNPNLAGQLALAAYNLDPSPESRGSVLSTATNIMSPRLFGHRGALRSVCFSPDGRTVLTAGDDRTARLWDLAAPYNPRQLAVLDHPDVVTAATFSPNGRIVATTSKDRVVRLWDVADPQGPRRLGQMTGDVSVAFHPDGNLLATGGMDQQVRLYDIGDSENPRLLATLANENPAFSMAFSPRHPILATGSNHDAQLWDITDRRYPRKLGTARKRTGLVHSVAFAQDGSTLAVAGGDNTVGLWDVTDPEHPRLVAELTDPGANFTSVTYLHDGHTLAIASDDGTIRMWDAGTPYAILTGDFGSIRSIASGPDGHTLAVAGDDSIARLVETDIGRAARVTCGWPDSRISRAQWEQYFPGLEYRPPCP